MRPFCLYMHCSHKASPSNRAACQGKSHLCTGVPPSDSLSSSDTMCCARWAATKSLWMMAPAGPQGPPLTATSGHCIRLLTNTCKGCTLTFSLSSQLRPHTCNYMGCKIKGYHYFDKCKVCHTVHQLILYDLKGGVGKERREEGAGNGAGATKR